MFAVARLITKRVPQSTDYWDTCPNNPYGLKRDLRSGVCGMFCQVGGIMTTRLRVASWCLVLMATGVGQMLGGAGRIVPGKQHPWYWEQGGRPMVLLGGSNDDNLFQDPDVEAQLDLMAEVGANYVRNTMSDRPDKGFEVYPFLKLPEGKYDLDQWNPGYWRRFERFLSLAGERGIVVQIEIWDRFDYWGPNWEKHPYNPANNINYSYEASGFVGAYPDHAGSNKQPFFFTTPGQRNNRIVLPYQQRFVERMLEASLPHGHVLYCMDNETSGDPAWGAYWANFIRERARAAGLEVSLTEMWDDWNLRGPQHRQTLDHSELYDFVDVSQNNHQKGQVHWDNFQWVREYLAEHPRPMNTVKTYGADGNKFGHTDRDGVERWWRHLVGGAAGVRFHRPDSGLGLSPLAQGCVRAARKVEGLVPWWSLEPAPEVLRDRDDNEAYAAAKPGGAYVVYFTDGGSVELDLSGGEGRWQVCWVEIRTGEWAGKEDAGVGGWVRLNAPGSGHWVAVILPD